MTPRSIRTSAETTPRNRAKRTESLCYTEEELCRRFDRAMEEVRAGRGIVKSLDELKAIEARIAAEP